MGKMPVTKRKREKPADDFGEKERKKLDRKKKADLYRSVLEGSEEPVEEIQAEPLTAPEAEDERKKFKVIVVLDGANLETEKTHRGGNAVLLSGDDHKKIVKKTGRDPAEIRPDIAHHCLLALLDSPLNKAGQLKVYVRTAKNVLIEVHSQIRIPRTYRRFAGLMAELLTKYKIRATNSQDMLLKVIKNPVTAYFPVGCQKFAFSFSSDKMVNVVDHAKDVVQREGAEAVVYVIGGFAKGKVEADWTEEELSISSYPLSGACVCNRLTQAYELCLDIL